ncbi:stAR-related lipid transfer protein 3-like isoform X2 [Ornithodoros turicata]|uniref:Putative cholesterol transporter bmstart1 n=1 Tax=Ornithodoros turicata TaxID=34597 RepID=A0A2R5LJY4_9ACAR
MGANRSQEVAYQEAEPHWARYGSINFDDEAPAEVLKVGASVGKEISPVRRFFALLATFDFCFCTFLWILCAMLQYKLVRLVFDQEVLAYSFASSLFDMAVLSGVRFVGLVVAYIILRLRHWSLVAVMAVLSDGVVISKTFFYDWQTQVATNLGGLTGVLLLVTSFVLPWGQAWFLDYRVVPSENKASQLLARVVNDAFPPVPSTHQHLRSDDGGTSFYSPEGSDNESVPEHDLHVRSETNYAQDSRVRFEQDSQIKQLTPEEWAYRKKAEEALNIALKIFHESNWKTEKMDHDGFIQTCNNSQFGKIYKYAGSLPASPETILDILFYKLEEQVYWNPSVREAKVIETIDAQTDIVYIVTDGAKGLVSSRDFVNLRMWQRRGESFLICVIAAEHVNKPPKKTMVRAEQGPLLYMVAPSESNANESKFQWLLNINLKGWLPQYMIDKAMSKSMFDYADALKAHLRSLPTSEVCA